MVTTALLFKWGKGETHGFNLLERNKVMNPKKIILLGCVAACVFAASPATAQMRGGHGGMGMRGGGMGMRGAFMPHSMGGMPMQRGPMMNSPSGFRRFGDRNFNRFGRFNRFNDFDRDDRFHRFNRFNRFNNVVFIGDFGFPWWWGWGPWWSWGWSPWWGQGPWGW